MAGVLLTHNYFLRYDTGEWREMRPWAPLGPLFQAAVLRDEGVPFRFYDTTFDTDEAGFLEQLRRQRPQLVLICADPFNVPQKMCLRRMRDAAFRMAAAARAQGATVLAAGPGPESYPITWLSEGGFDAILRGEIEWTQLQVWDAVQHHRSLREVPGLWLLGEDRASVHDTGRVKRVRDLSVLPAPARELIDVPRYLNAWRSHHGRSRLSLVTSRGCPFPCNWCSKPVYGRRFTGRPAESVVAEWADLKRRWRPDYLWVADEIFGLDRTFLQGLVEGIERERARIPFECLSRADLLDREGVDLLRRAGCDAVWMGAESGSQKVLDAMEKRLTVEQIEQSRALLGEAGIKVGFFLQFGYPGEEWEDIEATLGLVRRTLPDWIGISVTYPLPQTPFFDRVASQLGVDSNWQVAMECELLYEGPYNADFYKQLRKMVHRDFALQHEYAAWRRAPLRSAWRVPRMARLAAGEGALRGALAARRLLQRVG